jgi:dTDP-4-dehydrorhamnose reductase
LENVLQQRILVTGGNGTVGKALRVVAERAGHQVTNWDRRVVRYGDETAMMRYLEQQSPDVIVNLALASQDDSQSLLNARDINVEFPALLGKLCEAKRIRFLHTSSVMVFENSGSGPFNLNSIPAASEGYGREKRIAEERIAAECSNAIVARLGWQIGEDFVGNTMSHFLADSMQSKQEIVASHFWIPACSFVMDTAANLLDLAMSRGSGNRMFHIDGNRGWSFFEIATALNSYLKQSWKVRRDDSFVYDQRLLGDLVDRCDISRRLTLREL